MMCFLYKRTITFVLVHYNIGIASQRLRSKPENIYFNTEMFNTPSSTAALQGCNIYFFLSCAMPQMAALVYYIH